MNLKFVAIIAAVAAVVFGAARVQAAEPADGVAVAIVVDTSGSMNESVRDGNGRMTPKAHIAKRALADVLAQFGAYLNRAPAGHPRRVDLALFTFANGSVKEVIPMRPYVPAQAAELVNAVPASKGGTPLGTAMKEGAGAVLKSKMPHKHILIITDGQNTMGKSPTEILPQLLNSARDKQGLLSFHMVAFDISAQLFAPIKALGVNVVGAADEVQLNTQLGLILEKKILLEEEETPAPAKK